jgi:hypothetical protein
MPQPATSTDRAFRALAARLLARRIAEMGPRLWIVAVALIACVAAFTYWQVRVPLDGAVRHGGVAGGVQRLAVTLAACIVAGAGIAASRQSALLADPPGPEWLALPVEPAQVARHLAAESRLAGLVAAVPAAAAWLAGFGLLPIAWLLALAAAFAIGFLVVVRLACLFVLRVSSPASGAARALPFAWRALVSARQPVRGARIPPPRWQRASRWRALARLDRSVSLRAGSPRARLGFALLFLLSSVVAWFAGRELLEARALAFAAFSIACTGLGAWAAWRAAGDPPSALRALPFSLGDAWRARAIPLGVVLGAVLLLHALLPPGVPGFARFGLALTWAFPALLITLLGLHLGLSLAGSPSVAENLYYGWLMAAVVASLAIPLLGWTVVIAAFIQATRRVQRWNTPEVA